MTYGNYKGIDDSIETKDFSESQTPGASTSLKGVFFVDRYTNVMLIFFRCNCNIWAGDHFNLHGRTLAKKGCGLPSQYQHFAQGSLIFRIQVLI